MQGQPARVRLLRLDQYEDDSLDRALSLATLWSSVEAALRTSEMGYRGLGAGAARINALCAGTVVQWFAREAPRGNIRAHGI